MHLSNFLYLVNHTCHVLTYKYCNVLGFSIVSNSNGQLGWWRISKILAIFCAWLSNDFQETCHSKIICRIYSAPLDSWIKGPWAAGFLAREQRLNSYDQQLAYTPFAVKMQCGSAALKPHQFCQIQPWSFPLLQPISQNFEAPKIFIFSHVWTALQWKYCSLKTAVRQLALSDNTVQSLGGTLYILQVPNILAVLACYFGWQEKYWGNSG